MTRWPFRLLLWGALLALLALLATSAHAHPLGIATWSATQEASDSERWSITWRTSAQERTRTPPPSLLGQCAQVGQVSQSRAGSSRIRRWTVRCPGGLAGLRADERSELEVMVHARYRDGSEQRARLSKTVNTVALDSMDGGGDGDAEPTSGDAEAPTTDSSFALFVSLGFEHVLEGYDHLLFVLVLLMLAWPTGVRPPVGTLTAAITGFTLAHSVTLALSVMGWVTLPSAPIEAAIAWSVVVASAELARGRPPMTAPALLTTAGVFGLLHGFGFAGALKEVLGPTSAQASTHGLAEALVGFNVGVELGQLLFAGAALALGVLLGRWRGLPTKTRATGTSWVDRAVGYSAGWVAAFWMLDRLSSAMS